MKKVGTSVSVSSLKLFLLYKHTTSSEMRYREHELWAGRERSRWVPRSSEATAIHAWQTKRTALKAAAWIQLDFNRA